MNVLTQQPGDKSRILELERQLKDISNAGTEEDFDEKIYDYIYHLHIFRTSTIDTINEDSEEVQDILEDLLDILKALPKLSDFSLLGSNDAKIGRIDQRRAINQTCGSLSSAQRIQIGNPVIFSVIFRRINILGMVR